MLRTGLHQKDKLSIPTSWLHWLLPPVCLLCGSSLSPTSTGNHLCPTCIHACMQQPKAACTICSEPFNSLSSIQHTCGHCRTDPPQFAWLKTLGLHEKTLQRAIQQLKYSHRFQLARPLANLLLQQLQSEIETFSPEAIVPVPLHSTRLRQRGFNQSLLIGRQLAKSLCIPIYPDHLQRIRPTQSQTNLSRAQRHANLTGAFALHQRIPATRILLIDDVVTTTATARACTEILVRSGCEVAVTALSRARLQS